MYTAEDGRGTERRIAEERFQLRVPTADLSRNIFIVSSAIYRSRKLSTRFFLRSNSLICPVQPLIDLLTERCLYAAERVHRLSTSTPMRALA
jgi:hypothetical protein